jgi:hypothetical protein
MEKLNLERYEAYLRTTLGLLLIKPDALALGVEDYIIHYVDESLRNEKAGSLNGVYIIQIKDKDVRNIYATVKRPLSPVLKAYLTEDVSVLVTFKGDGKKDIWQKVSQLKGKRLLDRSENELDNGMGWLKGIRNAIPIPGTRELYVPVFERVKQIQKDPKVRFTEEEYNQFSRNLVHTPDDLVEAFALLSLLNKNDIDDNLPLGEFDQIKTLLQI